MSEENRSTHKLYEKADGIAKGRPPKLDKKIEEDLIAENQRLRMENEY